jgi:hypothetical protein
MSQRRKMGDFVWLSCIGPVLGQIADQRPAWMRCQHACGDVACMQWATVRLGESATYHIDECEMHDTQETAHRVWKRQRARRQRLA